MWFCGQDHGCERVVQEAAAGATLPSAVLHHGLFLGRDRHQSYNALPDFASQRLSHALQHRGTCWLHRFDQGKRESHICQSRSQSDTNPRARDVILIFRSNLCSSRSDFKCASCNVIYFTDILHNICNILSLNNKKKKKLDSSSDK